MKTSKHCICILLAVVASTLHLSAQIVIDSDNFAYSENFDDDIADNDDQGLGSHANTNAWNNNSTISGWYAAQTSSSNWVTNYRGDNLTNGSLYSYGGIPTERALGSLTTDASGDVVFGVLFENNAVEIHTVTISFRVEHWRRTTTDLIGYQRTKVSYSIDDPINLTPAYLFDDNNFVEVPEAFLVSIDTGRTALSMDGNLKFATISVTIPVTIPNGSQFFLRFDDDNTSEVDTGMGIDDVQVSFTSDNLVSRITAQSGYTVVSYLDMGIVADIADENTTYIIPDNSDIVAWTQILGSFYNDDNLSDVDASAYGYEAIHFNDLDGTEYHVLRKNNHSPYFWGTYVKPAFAGNQRLLIQAPHAVDDIKTGTQAAAVFYITGAEGLMLAGISRCASGAFALCSGTTKVCSASNSDEKFRRSDVSHEPNSIFHLATTIVANQNPSTVFVQLHGFNQSGSDPDFIVSCGTINADLKSVPDYPVIFRENLMLINPDLDFKIAHVDDYSELAGQTNVQGRYLNEYPDHICLDNDDPLTVTNRFLHIEQFPDYRTYPNFYVHLANALTQTINDNGYMRAMLVDSEFFVYSESFENFNADGTNEYRWGNNIQVQGWYAAGSTDDLFTSFHIAEGQVNYGGIYSFGLEGSGDRAFGSIATSASSSAGDIAYGVLFKNSTGVTLYGIDLEYDSEQWRDSDELGIQTVELSYQIADEIELHPAALLDNSAFTHFPDGDLKTSNGSGIIQKLNGDLNSVHIHVTIPFEMQPDQEIFVRFFDANNSGFDKALAVDNFVASFIFEAPMPVDWDYFNISKKNGRPLLEWATENENGCLNYDILRSDDGVDFEIIATLPCQREKVTNHYRFIDHSPVWQKNVYYKIAQYDEDGIVTYTPVKSFHHATITKPAVYYKDGELIIETDEDMKLESVNVLDFMGRVVCQGNPATERKAAYRLPCRIAQNQLLIIQLVFDSATYVVHMRTGG